MPSASITGKPDNAPTTSGNVALTPPASIGIMALNFFPIISSTFFIASYEVKPLGAFSPNTVGAPIVNTLQANVSSSISSGLIIFTFFPCSS